MSEPSFLERRLWTPILNQLKQGATPEQLTRSVAFGITLSLFPIFGSTTLLCFVAGVALRLNAIAIQAVNYLMTPIQIAAIPVLIKIGEKLFSLPPISFNPARLASELGTDPALFFATYGKSAAAGIFVWLLLAAPVVIGIEKLFLPILRKRMKEKTV